MYKLALTKKDNLIIYRKKFCDDCKRSFNVYYGKTKCPFCNSRKTHYRIVVSTAGGIKRYKNNEKRKSL